MPDIDFSGVSSGNHAADLPADARARETVEVVTVDDVRAALVGLADGRSAPLIVPVATLVGPEAPLWESLAAPDDVAAEALARVAFAQARDLVAVLHGQERLVLETLYGLGGRPPCSTRQAAEMLGISPAGVRKIERRALQKLRVMLGA